MESDGLYRVPGNVAEIPVDKLRIFTKPDWQGFWWNVVGPALVFLRWLGLGFARRAIEDFTHQWFGYTALAEGMTHASTRLKYHEALHVWQGANIPFHKLKVALDPRGIEWLPISRRFVSYRGHSEGMAYALDVINGRPLDNAARALEQTAYATGLDVAAATALILRYKAKLLTHTEGLNG